MRIFLIRHAKTETNDDIIVQGTEGRIIQNAGTIRKVEEVKKLIPSPDKIYCSELRRAKQTANLLYPDREDITNTALINEYLRPSRFIGGDKNKYIEFWDIHKNDKYNPEWRPEDGESYAECANRAESFFTQLIADKRNGLLTVAVIGHSTLFRHLVCALTGVEEWKGNARIVIDLLRRFPWNHLEVKEFEL